MTTLESVTRILIPMYACLDGLGLRSGYIYFGGWGLVFRILGIKAAKLYVESARPDIDQSTNLC